MLGSVSQRLKQQGKKGDYPLALDSFYFAWSKQQMHFFKAKIQKGIFYDVSLIFEQCKIRDQDAQEMVFLESLSLLETCENEMDVCLLCLGGKKYLILLLLGVKSNPNGNFSLQDRICCCRWYKKLLRDSELLDFLKRGELKSKTQHLFFLQHLIWLLP